MSLCDTCAMPGRCCRHFVLGGGSYGRGMTPLELLADLATIYQKDDSRTSLGVPFMPLFRKSDGMWAFWCPNLGLDGRCTDYANRPNTCVIFEPASDPLCLYYVKPAEACEGCTPFHDSFRSKEPENTDAT